MDTRGMVLRRGLPRVRGGEPWPPASEVPLAPESAMVAEAPAGFAEGNPAVAEVIPAVPDAGAPAASVAPVTASSAPRVLRRGLPRVRGGEPWPPASAVGAVAVPSAASVVTEHPVAAEVATATVASAPAASAPLASAPAASAPAASAPAETASGAPTATVAVPGLRRGLPREPGGEPWPPASVVPRAREAVVAQEATPGQTSLPPAAAPAPMRAEAQLPTPAAAESAATVAASDSVAPPADRGPLPFTPSVFPTDSSQRWTALREARRGLGPAEPVEPKRTGPFTRGQWAGAVVVGGAGLLFAAGMAVLLARWFVSLSFMQDFLASYPGEYHLPESAPVGIPAWLGWQHFFNVFLMVLIIRSGLQVRREKRPSAFWTPRWNSRGKISLSLWFHQSLDVLWLLNGAIFVVLLFVTGQWMRLVPTSWEVFPNALSAALQYVSLDWPTENGWVNYNSLQQLTYFATVFLAAPLAAITGVRMSGIWPKKAVALNRAYPIEIARAVHFPVMIYFVVFIVFHVTLVLATGALRNLNHMYGGQDAVNWAGFWIFAASLLVIVGGWVAARPLVLAPVARLFGSVSGR